MDSDQIIPMRCAVLRHDEGGGQVHFDWMLAREHPPSTGLETFRVSVRPDTAANGDTLALVPLGDHRLRYLTYEGPLSKNRGYVQRVASGLCIRTGMSILIQWGGPADDMPWQAWDFADRVATLRGSVRSPLATD